MRQRIVVLLLLLLPLLARADAPLTVEEAAAYIQADPRGAAEDVVKLDAIERAVPVVTVPAAAVIVTGRAVVVVWQDPIDMTIASLHYRITLQPVVAHGLFPPPRPWWEIPAWTAGGAAVGVILTAIVMVIAHALGP